MENRKAFLGLGILLGGLAIMGSRPKKSFEIIDLYHNGALLQSNNSSYYTRNLNQIEQVVVHHSATTNQTAADYANYHVNSKGWPGIGYHYVIEKDGTIIMGNPITNISYHVSGENTKSVGIALSGNFDIEEPTVAQMAALKWLISDVRARLPQAIEVYGHRDFGSTSCSGDNLYNKLGQFKLGIAGISDFSIYVGSVQRVAA